MQENNIVITSKSNVKQKYPLLLKFKKNNAEYFVFRNAKPNKDGKTVMSYAKSLDKVTLKEVTEEEKEFLDKIVNKMKKEG